MAALVFGFVAGFARLLLEMNKSNLSGFWFAFADVNYLHFALLLFGASVLIIVAFGCLTEPLPAEKVGRFHPLEPRGLQFRAQRHADEYRLECRRRARLPAHLDLFQLRCL